MFSLTVLFILLFLEFLNMHLGYPVDLNILSMVHLILAMAAAMGDTIIDKLNYIKNQLDYLDKKIDALKKHAESSHVGMK